MSNPISPDHYKTSRDFETIDVIHAFGLNYNLGNAVKYITRADRKGHRIQDLTKALNYIHREIFGTWFAEPVTNSHVEPTCRVWCGQPEAPGGETHCYFNYRAYCSAGCVDRSRGKRS